MRVWVVAEIGVDTERGKHYRFAMKATLEFILPEEASEHRAAVHAGDVLSGLSELDRDLRSYLKYGSELPFVREGLGAPAKMDSPTRMAEYVRARLAQIEREE